MRRGYARFYAGFGNFIERHPVFLIQIKRQYLRQMPRNRLSLTVGVGREQDAVTVCGGGFKRFYKILLVRHIDILRFKILIYINTELGFRQIAYMTHRGHYLVSAAEIFFYTLNLCR